MRFLLSLALCFASTAHAFSDVIYDNGAGGSAAIDIGYFADSDPTNIGFPAWEAEGVTLGSTITIRGVEWTGAYGFDNTPPTTDDFTIAFFADNGGAPRGGAPIASFQVGNQVNRTDSGFVLGNSNIFEYSANINFTMNSGTTYWISIYGNTIGENDDFFWGALDIAETTFASIDYGQSWNPFPSRQDFRLTNIPEPSSAALLSVCLMAGLTRRRTNTSDQNLSR